MLSRAVACKIVSVVCHVRADLYAPIKGPLSRLARLQLAHSLFVGASKKFSHLLARQRRLQSDFEPSYSRQEDSLGDSTPKEGQPALSHVKFLHLLQAKMSAAIGG